MEIVNRKQYLRPEMERVLMETEEMIQASPGLPSSPGTPGISGAQMREMPAASEGMEAEEELW
ncbi:MAG: hypothetical protein IKQ62_07485 [Bacteroidaceae bacterium]|nr:hypothetical protein [Bacteroidaceae bacterium]